MSLIKVAFFVFLGLFAVTAFDCAGVDQTACKDETHFYLCDTSFVAYTIPCPTGTTCQDIVDSEGASGAACVASNCGADFPNGAYKCADGEPSLSFTQCSNGFPSTFDVPAGTKCTQVNATYIELTYNLPTDCDGRPNGDQDCNEDGVSFTVCSVGTIVSFATPMGINGRRTKCVQGAGNVTFAEDFNSCEGFAVGAKRCTSGDEESFDVCTVNGWVQFSTPRGTKCQDSSVGDIEFLNNQSPCSPVGAEQCEDDTLFYWTCTEYGLERNRPVARDTKCENVNSTHITLVWALTEVPCNEGENIGDSTCNEDGATYTECTVLGRLVRDAPFGAFCVQNGSSIYFEVVTNTACGAVGTLRCGEDGLSFDTCTWGGWETQKTAKGTACSYDSENGGFTIVLSEETESQLNQLASILQGSATKNAGFGLLPSLALLAVAALALAF